MFEGSPLLLQNCPMYGATCVERNLSFSPLLTTVQPLSLYEVECILARDGRRYWISGWDVTSLAKLSGLAESNMEDLLTRTAHNITLNVLEPD